jgi:hypothetical protein
VTTLYLGATEVQVTKSSGTTPIYSAKSWRYYTHAAQRVAIRSDVPGAGSKLVGVEPVDPVQASRLDVLDIAPGPSGRMSSVL